MKDRAKFFGLDKAEGFREFEEKYLKAEKVLNKQRKGGIIQMDLQFFANSAEKDLQRQKTSSIRKSLETFDQRIVEHWHKIEHPEEHGMKETRVSKKD